MSELTFTSPNGHSLSLRLPDEIDPVVPEHCTTGAPTPIKERSAPTWPLLPLPPASSLASNTRKFGNPTPVGLGGFLLANTPATIMLLGWHGAGGAAGSEAAAIGTFFYMGCLLEVICGIGEWINGETFNAAVFLILGGYFGASGAVLVLFYNAIAG